MALHSTRCSQLFHTRNTYYSMQVCIKYFNFYFNSSINWLNYLFRNVEMSCTLTKSLPNYIKTCCVQEYINLKLITVDTSKNIYYEQFKLPSCCKCKYTDS